MALTKDLTLSSGVNLPNAYIRISHMNNKNGMNMEVKVDIFKDKSARDDEKTPVINLSHICGETYFDFFDLNILDQEGVNCTQQSYNFLKTIPFYEDAQDVDDVKE